MSHNSLKALSWLVAVGMCLTESDMEGSSITVGVGSAKGAPGSTVEVPIQMIDAQFLGALQMDLVFDPAVLTAKTIKAGRLPAEIALAHNVISPGHWRIGMNASAKESLSGDGTLLVASFEVSADAGRGCELRAENLRAWDNTAPEALPHEMLVEVRSGEFALGSRLPLPRATLIAIVAGLVVLAVLVGLRAKWRAGRAVGSPRRPQPASGKATVCPKCGVPNTPGTKFCGECGTRLPPPDPAPGVKCGP